MGKDSTKNLFETKNMCVKEIKFNPIFCRLIVVFFIKCFIFAASNYYDPLKEKCRAQYRYGLI